MDFILEERVEKACDLFRQGYNCSQSVFLAYNDLLGVESTLAATISGPLGGGMGRLREVCGAVSGMSLIAGFLAPCPDPAVRQAKAATYALVQEFAERFRAENGAIVCRELLGLACRKEEPVLRNGRPNITKSAPASNSSLVRPVLWGSTCNGRTLRRKSSCGRTLCLRSARPICRSSAIRHGFSSDFQSAGESGVYSAGKSRDSKNPSRHVSTLTPSR